MDEVILNTTESAPDFCVICWVRRLRFSRILLKFSTGFCDWGLLSCRGLHTWLGGLVRRILNVARIRIRRTCDSSWRSSLTKTWTFVASTYWFWLFQVQILSSLLYFSIPFLQIMENFRHVLMVCVSHVLKLYFEIMSLESLSVLPCHFCFFVSFRLKKNDFKVLRGPF